MIPERDIWAAALLLVKRYGDDATLQAAARADQLLAEGETEGAATWRAVVRAVERLRSEKPADGETVQ